VGEWRRRIGLREKNKKEGGGGRGTGGHTVRLGYGLGYGIVFHTQGVEYTYYIYI
jgi:hypothetical protein